MLKEFNQHLKLLKAALMIKRYYIGYFSSEKNLPM